MKEETRLKLVAQMMTALDYHDLVEIVSHNLTIDVMAMTQDEIRTLESELYGDDLTTELMREFEQHIEGVA